MPARAPAPALGPVLKVLGSLIRSPGGGPPVPGASLELLPAAEPASDLGWAASSPLVAEAFARAVAAVERGGRRSVPVEVRELVLARLDSWDGRPPGLSRSWLEDAVLLLAPGHRSAGRLALLVAFASYQVDDGVLAAYRAGRPDEADLVETAAWSALAAARQAGTRLAPGPAPRRAG